MSDNSSVNIVNLALDLETAVKELRGAVSMVSREAQTAAWMHPDGWWVKIGIFTRRDGSVGMNAAWSTDPHEVGEHVANLIIDEGVRLLPYAPAQ
jgi:hypothetical protein